MDRYTNPSIPASFSGISKFKQNNKKTPTDKIKIIDAYVLHKVPLTVFTRRKTIAPYVNSQWQVDMLDISNKNLKYKWLLVCVDVFSRYALVEPVPTKAAEQVRDAFENIFERNREIPQMIYSDSGREFMGKCGIMFASRKIYHKQDRSDMGGSIVERFNRTLRGKIERYITWVKSNDFLPVLQQLVQSYNNTIHPIHRRTPASVYKLSRAAQKSIYRDISQVDFTEWKKKDYTQQVIKFKFKIGDYVRIMAEKGVFKKATGMKRWSDVLYQVAQLCPTIPPTYKVVNDGELNDRSYYKEDMQKVNPPEKVNIQVKEPIQKLSLQKENVLSKHEKILRVKLPRAAKK